MKGFSSGFPNRFKPSIMRWMVFCDKGFLRLKIDSPFLVKSIISRALHHFFRGQPCLLWVGVGHVGLVFPRFAITKRRFLDVYAP
jgi:hypothetical protein